MSWDDFERALCWMILQATPVPLPAGLQGPWCGTYNAMSRRGWVFGYV